MSITQKLIVGYAAMAFFTLAALILSLLGLLSISNTAREIATADLPVISSLTRLRNSVLAQEGYAGRYAIFKGKEFSGLFRERERESLEILAEARRVLSPDQGARLKGMYAQYTSAADRLFTGKVSDTRSSSSAALRLLDTLDDLHRERQSQLQKRLSLADRERRFTIRWTLIISLSGFLLALLVAAVVTVRVSGAVRKLRRATHRIAAGEFDFDPQIPPGDEVGDLAADFQRMAARLKALEQASLDASPLTRLPGNVVIERELEERLQSGKAFAFCYTDLDNFKAFSDRYGYAKGSEMIRLCGDIIYHEVKKSVGDEGFVGHIGGDDFVMVLPDGAAATVCEAVIAALDAEVVKHYHPEDAARGGIEGVDRYGVQRFFPIISISIAVLVCEPGRISSAVEVARVTAELKDYVKEKPGSSYSIKRYREGK